MIDDLTGGERVRFNRYRNPEGLIPEDTREGQQRYGDFENDPEGAYFMPSYLSYSDYSGGTVEQSNVRVFREQFEALEYEEWWGVYGGHGTTAIVLKNDADERHDDLREFFEGLENDLVADDDDHSELEMEREQEDWNSYGAGDFERELRIYVPEDMEDRLERALEGKLFMFWRLLAEVANFSTYFEQGGGAVFDIDGVVWKTVARATDDEWVQLLTMLEDAGEDWRAYEYNGALYSFVRAIANTKFSQDELVALAWRKYGKAQFRRELRAGFGDTWGWHQADKLSDAQRAGLEHSLAQIESLNEASTSFLFWSVLQPIWDAQHPGYGGPIGGGEPIRFNFHWMTRYFARWALTAEFAVFMDALSDGSWANVQMFVPALREFMAQQK